MDPIGELLHKPWVTNLLSGAAVVALVTGVFLLLRYLKDLHHDWAEYVWPEEEQIETEIRMHHQRVQGLSYDLQPDSSRNSGKAPFQLDRHSPHLYHPPMQLVNRLRDSHSVLDQMARLSKSPKDDAGHRVGTWDKHALDIKHSGVTSDLAPDVESPSPQQQHQHSHHHMKKTI